MVPRGPTWPSFIEIFILFDKVVWDVFRSARWCLGDWGSPQSNYPILHLIQNVICSKWFVWIIGYWIGHCIAMFFLCGRTNRAYWICVLLRGFSSLCQKTQSWKTHSQITQGWKTQGQTKYNHVSSRGSQIELRLNSDWTRRNCRSPSSTTHSCTPIAPRSNDKVPLGTRRTPHQAHQNIALRAHRNHTRSHA